MKIAIPSADNQLAAHFGHCREFLVFDIEDGVIRAESSLPPPPHEPGVLPRFLAEQQVTCIIAGGMGMRAQQLFAQNGIQVVTGAQGTPREIVEAFLANTLETGDNLCDH
jgi:predicted Fe-Mo cluster-binding NifX family protein